MLVCGEHDLLSVINDRVRQLQRADETTKRADSSAATRSAGYFFALGLTALARAQPLS